MPYKMWYFKFKFRIRFILYFIDSKKNKNKCIASIKYKINLISKSNIDIVLYLIKFEIFQVEEISSRIIILLL